LTEEEKEALANTLGMKGEELHNAVEELERVVVEQLLLLWDTVKDAVGAFFDQFKEEDCRAYYGETDRAYWVWDVEGRQIACIDGRYSLDGKKIIPRFNDEGEVVSWVEIK